MNAPNVYVFSRTYEQGTKARDAMHEANVNDMNWKADKLGEAMGKTIVLGFWWRGWVEPERLEEVRAALSAAGCPVFEEPEKVGAT